MKLFIICFGFTTYKSTSMHLELKNSDPMLTQVEFINRRLFCSFDLPEGNSCQLTLVKTTLDKNSLFQRTGEVLLVIGKSSISYYIQSVFNSISVDENTPSFALCLLHWNTCLLLSQASCVCNTQLLLLTLLIHFLGSKLSQIKGYALLCTVLATQESFMLNLLLANACCGPLPSSSLGESKDETLMLSRYSVEHKPRQTQIPGDRSSLKLT